MRKLLITNPETQRFGVSQGCETESFVFVAAMAIDYDRLERLAEAETIADETRICLQRIDERLRMAGCSLADVVKTTVYLADRDHQREFMETYREFWEEGSYPLRCTVFVGLAANSRVEIDAVAVKPAQVSP